VTTLAGSHKAQIFSLFMLLFTSTGVMLPLEVALNRIWHIPRNRSFLANQAVAYGLTFGCALCALGVVALTAINASVIQSSVGALGWTQTAGTLTWLAIKLTTLPATIIVFFALYYYLPNAKVPKRPVLLAAVFAGVVTELVKHVFIWLLPWLNFREVYAGFYISASLLMWSFVAAMVMLVGAYFAAYGHVQQSELAANHHA